MVGGGARWAQCQCRAGWLLSVRLQVCFFFSAAREFGAWRQAVWGRASGSSMAPGPCRHWLIVTGVGKSLVFTIVFL